LIGSFLSGLGCERAPQTTFARLLERAASWASATQFAVEAARAGRVPGGYINDLLETGSTELVQIRSKIADSDDMVASTRSEAAGLCDQLASALKRAGSARALPDVGRLQAIEARLRALARAAREASSGGASD
jgi:hypothetical protein